MENPIKMDDLGVTTIFGNTQMCSHKTIPGKPPFTFFSPPRKKTASGKIEIEI